MSQKRRKKVTLLGLPPGYDEWGRAELEFKDKHGVLHFIYLDPKLNLYTHVD